MIKSRKGPAHLAIHLPINVPALCLEMGWRPSIRYTTHAIFPYIPHPSPGNTAPLIKSATLNTNSHKPAKSEWMEKAANNDGSIQANRHALCCTSE